MKKNQQVRQTKTKPVKADSSPEQTVEGIAARNFGFTLRRQNSDRLDFHDVGVVSLKDALLEAYKAGQTAMLDVLKTAMNKDISR